MHPVSCICLVTFLASHATVAHSRRIAMLPFPFTSHCIYHSNVARALLEMGHEVWLIMADEVTSKRYVNTTGCNIIEYTTMPDMEDTFMVDVRDAYFEKRPAVFDGIFELYKKHIDILLTDKSFMTTLRELDLDLFVLDNIFTVKMLTILPYRLKVPFAFLGSCYDPIAQRIPFAPATTPFALHANSDRMTFQERLQTTLFYLSTYLHDPATPSDAVSRYAPDMPDIPLDMLVAQAEIWLVEIDHILDYPRPSIPNVKLIGGTATGPARPLPAGFKSFMDGAGTEGVVVVSFGSYVLHLPEDISSTIFRALKKLPFKTVFRSNLTSPDPKKILTSSWLPQNDLIGHKNTRVFVTHCGKNGQYEALYHAVPVICMPIFTDQPYNAERMRVKGMAERLDLNTVAEEELTATILKVGTEKRYKQAIARASEIFHVEFGIPKQSAAFWLNHVIKYGGAHMRSAGQDMPYYQFIGLDVLVVLFLPVLLFFVVVSACLWCICLYFCTHILNKQKTD